MRCILFPTKAATNEEYKKVIKKRMRYMIALIVVGIITAGVGFVAEFYWKVKINQHMLGVYTGVGTGLFAGGVVLWIKNKMLLNNEEKLKESRLSDTDERMQEIENKAFRIASYVMIVVLYGFGLIGGLYYPVFIRVLVFVMAAFLLAYTAAHKYYNSKM